MLRKPKPKMKRGTIKNKLWEVQSKILRAKYQKCVLCGKTQRLQCGHIFSRDTITTSFDIHDKGNCHCQCDGCNQVHKKDMWIYYDWYIGKWGKDEFDKLYGRYKNNPPDTSTFINPVSVKEWELFELLEKLTEIYNNDYKEIFEEMKVMGLGW